VSLLVALRFLTIIPLPGPARVSDKLLGRSTAWYPLVGVLLGGVLYGCGRLLTRIWSPWTLSALCLAIWVILTRGLHLDGLADTLDGLGGGATPSKRRAIMKDSRIGVFGALGLVLLLLLKLAFIAELAPGRGLLGLLLAPVLGRWAMLLAVFAYPSAVQKGLGHLVKAHCRWPQFALGTALAVVISFLILRVWGLACLLWIGGWTTLSGFLLTRAFGGLSGDSYGALCELQELVTLGSLALLAGLNLTR